MINYPGTGRSELIAARTPADDRQSRRPRVGIVRGARANDDRNRRTDPRSLEKRLPTFVSATAGGGRVAPRGVCRGIRAKEEEGRAACSHGAATAALHLNGDKSRSFEDTGPLGYKRGKRGVQRPVDSQTGGRRPDQCITLVERPGERRTARSRFTGEGHRRETGV